MKEVGHANQIPTRENSGLGTLQALKFQITGWVISSKENWKIIVTCPARQIRQKKISTCQKIYNFLSLIMLSFFLVFSNINSLNILLTVIANIKISIIINLKKKKTNKHLYLPQHYFKTNTQEPYIFFTWLYILTVCKFELW